MNLGAIKVCSKWGVCVWFQNSYFQGNNGHLILIHTHFVLCLLDPIPAQGIPSCLCICNCEMHPGDEEKDPEATSGGSFE